MGGAGVYRLVSYLREEGSLEDRIPARTLGPRSYSRGCDRSGPIPSPLLCTLRVAVAVAVARGFEGGPACALILVDCKCMFVVVGFLLTLVEH